MSLKRKYNRYGKGKAAKNIIAPNPTEKYYRYVNYILNLLSETKEDWGVSKENKELYTTEQYVSNCVKSECFTLLGHRNSDGYGSEIIIHPIFDGVGIYKIEVAKHLRRNGIGKSILNMLTYASNITKSPLYLIPIEYDSTPIDVLRDLYHKFDFSRMSNSKYWKYEPKFISNFIRNNDPSFIMVHPFAA